jgi:hypothetical protein
MAGAQYRLRGTVTISQKVTNIRITRYYTEYLPMDKIIRKISKFAGFAVIAAVLVAAFMAYAMGSVDSSGHIYDGLGRELVSKPSVLKTIFGDDRWAGLGWRIIDAIWFFGGFYLAVRLFGYSNADTQEEKH